jgi:flagellar hook-associated protein 3 FlgL
MVAITGNRLADEILRQQRLSKAIAEDQTAISSQKKIRTASDDPQAWVQISDIARQQSSQAAYTANIAYGQARAAKAETNLGELNTLFNQARELIITAGSTDSDAPSQNAIVASLQAIKQTLKDLLDDTDYQGISVFDGDNAVRIPVSRGITLDPVPTRDRVNGGVDVGGTTKSLQDIIDDAISAVQSGDSDRRDAALTGVRNGLDHVIVNQSEQGVRSQMLEDALRRTQDYDLSLSERRSTLEDTDLTETLTKLQAKLTTLQAAQAAFAKINSQSLFDLLT